jgi:hypothetical protein
MKRKKTSFSIAAITAMAAAMPILASADNNLSYISAASALSVASVVVDGANGVSGLPVAPRWPPKFPTWSAQEEQVSAS